MAQKFRIFTHFSRAPSEPFWLIAAVFSFELLEADRRPVSL
jgi:hypothetical protein